MPLLERGRPVLESLVSALLGTFMLGLATWHTARVLADGSLFEGPRSWLEEKTVDPLRPEQPWHFIYGVVSCRLCLNTQVAYVLTWVALAVGTPWPIAYQVFAFVVGPLVVAAWAEVIRKVEGIRVL